MYFPLMHFGTFVDRCCHEVDEDSNEISSLRSDISGPLAGEALSFKLPMSSAHALFV